MAQQDEVRIIPNTGRFFARQAASAAPNPQTSASQAEKKLYVYGLDLIFPHIAAGGGWETEIVLVNMGLTPIEYVQEFFAPDGKELEVPVRTPDNPSTRPAAAITARIPPGRSSRVQLPNAGGTTLTGWSALTYDTSTNRLGGYALFRQKFEGRPDFETVVPLSAKDDPVFFMPFDNTGGFVTTMAIVNPSGTTGAQIEFLLVDDTGTILTNTGTLVGAGKQFSFSLPQFFPSSRAKAGVLIAESSTPFLSAFGLRFNPAGAFTTVPILNWAGMF